MKQYSTEIRDSWNTTYRDVIGPSPKLQIFEGTVPVNCEALTITPLLVEILLPEDWLVVSGPGVIQKTGSWSGTAQASGVSGFYRVVDQLNVCHEQGTIGEDGSGADLEMNILAVEFGQSISVNNWTITAPGA